MKGKKRGSKKGISPVVSTVLLIMIVIVLAIIILMWSRGFIKEAYTKNVDGEDQSTDNICKILSIEPIINDDGSFGLRNTGNIPIAKIKLKLKLKDSGESNTEILEDTSGKSLGLSPGQNTIITGKVYDDYEEIKIIPILLANKQSGGDTSVEVPCPESGALKI